MFSPLMTNTWVVASIVAVVAGVVGFFVVMRGSSFVAHAVPQSGFAGAAGASLLGVNTLFGLGLFAVAAALGIGWLSRRGRHDAVTALGVAVMLGLGSLFLSWSVEYAPQIYALLFGEVLGVASSEILPTALLGLGTVLAVAVMCRPLLLSSVAPDIGEARGVSGFGLEMAFLLVVAAATTATVPVVGALLMFSLMVGPPAAARALTASPYRAMIGSVLIALVIVWVSIAAAYQSNWPIGFFVGVLGAVSFVIARIVAWSLGRRHSGPRSRNDAP